MSAYAKHNARLLNNQSTMNTFTQFNYGMNPSEFEANIQALADVRAGRMPKQKVVSELARQAREAFGWSDNQTKQALQRIIDIPIPSARVAAFLHEGGRQPTADLVRHADTLAQNYAHVREHTALEVGLAQRQIERDNDPLRTRMPEYKAGQQEIADRNSLRGWLEFYSGSNKPQSFHEKQNAVVKARLQVADRYELYSKKPDPSLRDTIAANLEVSKVNELSKEYGLGDPMQAAKDEQERVESHLREDFDPIESTGLSEE